MATQTVSTRYRVDGMDCAGCAAKVDAAVRRLKGVADVEVSVTTGHMNVEHAADTDLARLEKRVQALGYDTTRQSTAGATASEAAGRCCGGENASSCCQTERDSDEAGRQAPSGAAEPVTAPPWYRNAKKRAAVVCGLALAAAFSLSQVFPAYSVGFFGIAVLTGLIPVARRAITGAILARTPFSIEMLMTIATIGAFALGATREAGMVVLLFLIGELLEGVAAGRARSSISALSRLVPQSARRVDPDGSIRKVAANTLERDAIVLVRPGDRIPADGVVTEGESAVDQAPVTGESTPVTKRAGATVFAGTINGSAALRVRVTAAASNNTIARIVALVEAAQESKAPTARFIDRFSRVYTPGVVAVAAAVAVLPPLVFGGIWHEWIYKGLTLLLIGCPCALVISTPAAVAASLSAGARRGLLVKGGAVLESLGSIDTIAFDKTGTLTEGRPRVTDVFAADDNDDDELLRLAAALETQSSHPLGRAVVAAAEQRSLVLPAVDNAKTLGGLGISGRIDGRDLFLGSPDEARRRATIDDTLAARIRELQTEGKSVALVVEDTAILGVLAMRDEPRADAGSALQALKAAGVRCLMLTGDNERTAAAIGRMLDIEVRAGLLPEDKQRIVRELQSAGHRVAKVGDGINDAPALAAADVGIAMGGGTDVALETGDAASLHGRIGDVGAMRALSRRTLHNIYQNIGLALGLKAIFLITTIAGLTGLLPAILTDVGATVLVTANALRLLRSPADTAAGPPQGSGPPHRLDPSTA